MKSLFAIILACAPAALPAQTLSVLAEPGTLSSKIESPASVSALRVTGTIDASDFHFIDTEMPALRQLDLKDCRIAAYNGDLINGLGISAAATIPTGALAGSPISSVVLPEIGKTAIGDCAFAGSALEAVVLPSTVTTVGQGAFGGCPSLKNVTIAGNPTLKSHVFKSCTSLAYIDFGNLAVLPEEALADCPSLATLSGMSSLTAIGHGAFAGCESLTSFAGGNSLSTIGDWSFAGCSSLKTLTLPESLGTIGRGAFFGCSDLMALKLPGAVSTLADYSLKGVGLAELLLPAGLTSIGHMAMAGTSSLKTIDARTTDRVPDLGEEVWRGIDQSDVTLMVPGKTADAYGSTPQWQDFNIVIDKPQGGLENAYSGKLSGRFLGYILQVDSGNLGIAALSLYDTDGHHLLQSEPMSDSVSVDTSALDGHIFIVRITLADGTAATLKLLRN